MKALHKICICLLLALASLGASGAESKRVLFIHSFGWGFEPVHNGAEHLRTELASQMGAPIDFFDVSLESTRLADLEQQAPLLDYLRAQAARRQFDLVVAVGGPAAQFAQQRRQQFFPETPMLMAIDTRYYNRVNRTAKDRAACMSNDPGLTVKTMLQVLPETTNVVVVMGNSTYERIWSAELQRDLQQYTNRVNFVWLDQLPFPEMVERCATLPPRSAILFVLLCVDAAGVPHQEERVLMKLHEAANAPIFGVWDTQLGQGILGGRLVDSEKYARTAANAAARILRGESPGSIAIAPESNGLPEFDWRELRRWGISEARLPADSQVRFRQPGVWERYWWQVGGGILLVAVEAALIVGLLVNRAKRRQGELMARLISDLSTRFIHLPADRVDPEIEAAQRRVCESLRLDISSLWQWRPDNPGFHTLTHLYRPLGGPPAPQTMNGQDFFPWCQQQVLAGKVVMVASLADMPAEAARDREVFRHYGIKTTLTIPLSAGGGPVFGSVNFNDTRRERRWSEALVQQLQLVAQIFANALARKAADQALRESEGRLNLAADAAAVGLWSLNLDTDRFWLTDKTRELFNFTSGAEVTSEQFLSLVHPDDQSPVRETLRTMVQTGSEGQMQYRAVWPDGRARWMLSRGRVRCGPSGKPEHVMGVTVDITERKMAEEKLRQSSEVLERSPVLVVITDTQGRINYVNRKFSEVTGYSHAEIIGQNPRIFKSGESPPAVYRDLWATITQGQTWRGEFHNRKKSGELYWEWAVISPLTDETGKITHFVAIKEDITARKRAEQELAQQRNQLTHLSRVNMLGELAGSLAHELNQPLTAVLSNAQAAQRFLAQDPPDLNEVRDILADIVAEDKRAGEVIRRLRLLLKKGEVQHQPLDVNEVVQEVLKLVRSDLVNQNFTAQTDLAPDLPVLLGDRVQLQQVLLNLVMNACDAMAGGERDQRQFTIRTRQGEDGSVHIAVTDRGAGIAPDKLGQVFEPFYTTKPHGMGLGLAVCRTIVSAHGGKLWATNNPGRGATFHIALPVSGKWPAASGGPAQPRPEPHPPLATSH